MWLQILYFNKIYLLLAVLCVSAKKQNGDSNPAQSLEENEVSCNEYGSEQPVTVSQSGVFHGGYNITRGGRKFESYRGIRYAEPPVGELRFQPPVLITKYKTPVDAREDGPACPQPASYGYPVDEDCLTINVYTPLKKNRSKPLPVIFFLHPGAYFSMTGRSDFAGPHYLLDRDLVLVTSNYRLGSLGFLSTGDALAPGNNGLKDQVAALRWVQRNIAAFGGDPASVTIAGCSVGSFSVLLHMVSPLSRGLFHKGISISGSPVGMAPLVDKMYHLAVKQAQLLNCPTDNSKVIIDCLKTKPWKELGDSLTGFYEFGVDPSVIWTPVVEKNFGQKRFLESQPADDIRKGRMHAVPYIVSQTSEEFLFMAFDPVRNQTLRNRMNAEWETIAPISFLLPKDNKTYAEYAVRKLRSKYLHEEPLANDEESTKNLGLLYSDSIACFPVHRLANLMNRHSPHPVWYYEFAYTGKHSFFEDPVTMKPVVVEKDYGQERFLVNQPADDIREGRMQAVPYIVSQTTDEFFWMAFNTLNNQTLRDRMNAEWETIAPISFQLPRDNKTYAAYAARRLRSQYLHDKPLVNDAETARNLGLLYADSIESFPVHRMANLMNRHSPHPVWYYEFAYIGKYSHYEDPVTMKPVGASHHDDLIYLFTLSFRFPTLNGGPDGLASDRITALWYNFARYGDPNPRGDTPELQGLKWPAMTPDQRNYLRFDKELTIHKNLKEERMPIWEELYPIKY